MVKNKAIGTSVAKTGKAIRNLSKAVIAGASGAMLVIANIGRSIKTGVAEKNLVSAHKNKKSREVIEVKKSTFVSVLVFLAAVAGALGALYVYVLRREKELDEYEKLLFSEDFNDDFPEDEVFDLIDEEDEAEEVVEEAVEAEEK